MVDRQSMQNFNLFVLISLTSFSASFSSELEFRSFENFRKNKEITFNLDDTNFNRVNQHNNDGIGWYTKTWIRNNIAKNNIRASSKLQANYRSNLKDGEVINFNPGDKAPPFSLWTINGNKLDFPSPIFRNKSIFIHVFDPDSGFLECLWNTDIALLPLLNETTENTSFIFIPKYAGPDEKFGAVWMQNRLKNVLYRNSLSADKRRNVLENFHFSVHPLNKLGNWIPSLLHQWQCVDHNCGLDQVLIQSENLKFPLVLKRFDARYDWLPSPVTAFGNKTLPLVHAGLGCQATSSVNGSLALVNDTGCSYFQKISVMAKSGAVGVVINVDQDRPMEDMSCNGTECETQISIPASMIRANLTGVVSQMNVSYQNTPSENFFMAIDSDGILSEVGWFLYPSMKFLIWQSQWFGYKKQLETKLNEPSKVVKVFEAQTMQGNDGVVVSVSLPDLKELRTYSKMELDMTLSCPGTKDTTCPHWDHTINLYICCDKDSPLCGMEFGRWISAFRRRIGRWLTDVSPLLPLLTGQNCTFTMKSVPWAMPWIPSLNLRFSRPQKSGGIYPAEAIVLYEPGATFDKNYNSHFKPLTVKVPNDVVKVEIFAVITGHGSDENGCGEFCVTSHHFVVNGYANNITFSNAGSPFGCADRVSTGVEPNEHGTWLYGRNGWCDGQNVFPWVIDITSQIKHSTINTVHYFGYFNGTDPNPKQNPGIIYIYSYLVFYRKIN